MAIGKKPKEKQEVIRVEPHELITDAQVEQIRQSLIESHADLVVRGMLDRDVRQKLENVVKRDHNLVTKGNPEVIAYVVRETIGTGVIEEILQDVSITDIGYNGKELILESNDMKIKFDTNFPITDEYIVRIVNKFANANNKEFTVKNPIFDGRFENVRINAVHSQNTAPESGTTMALRVVRPRLALQEHNFEAFAPKFMLDFFKAAAESKSNMVISGTTGTGKTELHKLIARYIPFEDRILLIEDTPETFMKQMFPEKDVYSWVTSEEVNVTKLIKAGLRNHPTWIMVTETRGAEAYEMIQAVLSGHSIITSLHATDARAIPARFVNMAKMGYELSEDALIDDIRRYFHFGIHIKKTRYQGHVIRYLSEVLEFNPDGDKTIFKQRFIDGVYHYECFELPQDFIERMEDTGVTLHFPEPFAAKRAISEDMKKAIPVETVIPLDKTGRPDMEKIKELGTSLDVLMGRAKPEYIGEEDRLDVSKYVTKEGFLAPETMTDIGESESYIQELKRKVQSDPEVQKRLEEEEAISKPPTVAKSLTLDIEELIQRVNATVERELIEEEKEEPPKPVFELPKPRKREVQKTVQELLEEKKRLLEEEDF